MFPGGNGQIRSQLEESSTIYLDCFLQVNKKDEIRKGETYFDISVIDFASPDLDEERNPDDRYKPIYKRDLINLAETIVANKLQ